MGQRHRTHPIPDHARLGAFIKQLRKRKHVTQVQLAERLGHAHSSLWRIETGYRQLLFLEFLDLCDALSIEPDEFIREFQNFRESEQESDPR